MFKAEYIFVRILVPFVIGIGLAYFLQSDRYFWVFALIHLIALSMLIGANMKYQQLSLYRFKGAIGAVFLLLFFSLGALICLMNCQSMQKDYFGKKQYTALKIWITDEPQVTNHISRFKGRVTMAYQGHKCEQVSGTLLIAIKLDSTEVMPYQYGEELVISCSALPVERPYNPAEFDFQSWLANQNIYLQAFVKHKQVIKTNKNVGNTLVQFALQLRKNQINKYRNLIKNDEAFAVASTLILGYRADLSNQTLAAYTKTGTIHALSVSGAHVAIIYLVINFLLCFMDRRKNLKILKFILICTIIWNYALITGLSPSVIRSAIMITVFMVCKTFAKTGNSYNILAFSAFLQLIYNPFLLWDVGFQLSYLAVFGLLYLQPKIYNWFFIRHKWLDKLWNFIALSLAAQMVSFPLSLYYFHQFPVYFLLANLFISLPLVVMMYLGIIILIPGMGFLSPIFEWIICSTNLILKWMANLPFATISSVWISFPQFILLSLALSFMIYALIQFNKKWLFASLVIFISFQISVLHRDVQVLSQHQIIFFSLRKNYAAAFIKGRSAFLITDLKKDDKNYQFYVQPALEQAQILNVSFLSLNRDTVTREIIIRDHQVVFQGYKMLFIDQRLNYKELQIEGEFSALWLHQNTRFNLNKLPSRLKFKSIIIDATNKDYQIEKFVAFAKNIHLNAHILKKNKAYLVQLTP